MRYVWLTDVLQINSAVEHNMDVADLKSDIIGLSVYTEYSIWVVAVNEYGPGSATEEKLVRTYSDIPTDTPRNITVEPSSTVSAFCHKHNVQ